MLNPCVEDVDQSNDSRSMVNRKIESRQNHLFSEISDVSRHNNSSTPSICVRQSQGSTTLDRDKYVVHGVSLHDVAARLQKNKLAQKKPSNRL